MNVDEWGIPITEVPQYEEYTPPKKADENMFRIMYSSLDKKMKPTEEQKKKISAFLFDNILANNESTIDLALMFTTHNIPVNKQYDMVRVLLPKCYIPYPKKSKKPQKDIEEIMTFYDVNERIADQYFDMMTPEERKKIKDKFKSGVMK